jgi:hypothetical protein
MPLTMLNSPKTEREGDLDRQLLWDRTTRILRLWAAVSCKLGVSPAKAHRVPCRARCLPQALAPYRQKSRMRAVGVGPAISPWLSRMLTAPVDEVMCAVVPVPPTQP